MRRPLSWKVWNLKETFFINIFILLLFHGGIDGTTTVPLPDGKKSQIYDLENSMP